MLKRTMLALAAVGGLSLLALPPATAEASHRHGGHRGCGPSYSRGYHGGYSRGYGHGNYRPNYNGYGRGYGGGGYYGRGYNSYGNAGYYGYGSGITIRTPGFGFGYYGW